jgi:hypothetical protein
VSGRNRDVDEAIDLGLQAIQRYEGRYDRWIAALNAASPLYAAVELDRLADVFAGTSVLIPPQQLAGILHSRAEQLRLYARSTMAHNGHIIGGISGITNGQAFDASQWPRLR